MQITKLLRLWPAWQPTLNKQKKLYQPAPTLPPLLSPTPRPAFRLLCYFLFSTLIVFSWATFPAWAETAPPEGATENTETAPPTSEVSLADILAVPQDLVFFAAQAGMDTLLLSPEEQAKRNTASDQRFFGPWNLSKPGISAKDFQNFLLRKPRGFCWDTPWSSEAWEPLLTLANTQNYPSPRGAAIVVRHTNLRSMPTNDPLYMEPTPTPEIDFFDFFQIASLALGTPVYVSHASSDQNWFYIEYPHAVGWVRTEDIALMPRDTIKTYKTRKYAVVVQDNLSLDTSKGPQTTHIGAVYPLAQQEPLEILVPVRAPDGSAHIERVRPPAQSLLPKPLPLTPGALAELGTRMLGQPYAWGGLNQGRDCSLATRDLFAPFGIWLPRNSQPQVKSRTYLALDKLSPEARKEKILAQAQPFRTLLGFPGHVGLYVGIYNEEPVMLHNILGIRTTDPDTWFRYLIARCILSTLEPGKDLLPISESLLDRLHSMRTLF